MRACTHTLTPPSQKYRNTHAHILANIQAHAHTHTHTHTSILSISGVVCLVVRLIGHACDFHQVQLTVDVITHDLDLGAQKVV